MTSWLKEEGRREHGREEGSPVSLADTRARLGRVSSTGETGFPRQARFGISSMQFDVHENKFSIPQGDIEGHFQAGPF